MPNRHPLKVSLLCLLKCRECVLRAARIVAVRHVRGFGQGQRWIWRAGCRRRHSPSSWSPIERLAPAAEHSPAAETRRVRPENLSAATLLPSTAAAASASASPSPLRQRGPLQLLLPAAERRRSSSGAVHPGRRQPGLRGGERVPGRTP